MYFKNFVPLASLAFVAILSISGCGGSSAKPSVTLSPATKTVDATNSVSLSATVAKDKASAGVSWNVSGGGALSGSTTSATTYTAPAPSSSALTVTVTATSVADATKTATAIITVPPAPAVTTGALVAGTVGTAYSGAVAASGGIPPYVWTITSGTLPAGVSMNSSGAISGTPTAAGVGTTNLTFRVTDAGTPNALSATATLGLTIAAAPSITFTTASLPQGTYKSAYSASVAATGGAGALTYSLLSGTPPTGVVMAPTGTISGTPTVVGSFPITVQAADAFGDTGTQALTLTVSYPALAITPLTPPTGYVGSAYTSTTLAATGGSGTGYAWSVASGSAMPAGLNLSAAGVISGTPTATGTTSVTVAVTDSASNTAELAISILVKPAVSITTTATLPVGYVGSAYSQTLAATGGSGTGYTWTISSGSTPPAGLALSSAGVLGGTPTATGTPSFTVTVTDSASNTASATFSMTVDPGVSITTSTTLLAGYQGDAYPAATLAATGGNGGPYTWTWAAAGGASLPAGLSLSTAGTITGTPTGSGTFNIVVTATDSASNKGTATFTLTIEAALAVTTTTLNSGTVNVAYSQTLAATGGSGTGYTWTTTGPSTLATLNLSLSAAGVLSGIPTTAGTATFTAQVTDSQSHTASAALSVSVFNALTITTTTLPAASVGTAYSQTLNAGGGSGSGYAWTATASNLATYGLSLSAAGVVSGSPTNSGTASFTANVTDSGNNTALQTLSITIYNALTLTAPSSTVPGPATVGSAYNSAISASGGSGSYTWTVTGLPAESLIATLSGSTQNITGTPTSATTVTFTMQVLDTVTNMTAGPYTYSIVVSSPPPLVLPAPNPTSLPAATVNTAYSGFVNATGGASPYTWTVNSVLVPANGTAVPLSNGLHVSNAGNNTLTVAGTPTSIGTVTIAASIKDNLGTVAGPNTYTLAVNSAGSPVNGQIGVPNNCGLPNLPSITLSINTTPVQTTTTDPGGHYSFNAIPNGTFTITPSIIGPSSLFWPPAITNVVVNNSAVIDQNFTVSLGYTASGTVSYTGTTTGHIYLTLNNTSCGGNGPGTSIGAPGSFTIRGVPPGSYSLQAWMDPSTLATGAPNTSDPVGSASLTISSSNATGVNVTLSDPAVTSPPSANPGFGQITPSDQGVSISYQPVTDSNRVEAASSYDVQWSSSSSFATSPVTYNFKATGQKSNVWILNNSTQGLLGNPFTNGQTLYFRARSRNSAGPNSGWSVYGGATPTATTIGASTAGNTVTGAVTIPASVTPTGPMYVGFYNQNTGNVYGVRLTAPVVGGNAYTIKVPSASGYFNFAILDQNNDGMIDAGDVTNTDSSLGSINISGNLTGQDISLPSANSTATVVTQYQSGTYPGGSFTSYSLNLDVRAGNKLPVAVQLISGPHVINPLDIGNACQGCGTVQFQTYMSISGAVPSVGDTYSFHVTYIDGTSETVNAAVTAFGSGSAVVGANDLATNLTPSGTGTSTTPTFTWTDPVGGSAYVYSFYLSDNFGNTIWQIPGNNSQSNGFTSSTTSITWGTDPTGGGNNPTLPSLSSGTQYNWSIFVQDSIGNQAQASVYYIP